MSYLPFQKSLNDHCRFDFTFWQLKLAPPFSIFLSARCGN